jgi:hypothetical protein
MQSYLINGGSAGCLVADDVKVMKVTQKRILFSGEEQLRLSHEVNEPWACGCCAAAYSWDKLYLKVNKNENFFGSDF